MTSSERRVIKAAVEWYEDVQNRDLSYHGVEACNLGIEVAAYLRATRKKVKRGTRG